MGHSLGGGLASAAMLAMGEPGVTFNAAGLSDSTLRSLKPGKTPHAIREELAGSGQIRRYNVEGALLTGLQGAMLASDAVGHELRLAASRGACCNFVGLHGGKGDGRAYVEALREGASLLGHAQRGAGKATGQEASFNQAALRVETAGERANALIDGASHEAAVLTDKAGDGAKRAASEAADDVKRTSDKMTQGVQWLTEKTRAVGGAISQGAQKARDAIAEAGRTIADLFNR